jgi:DMSO reductase family type II enzyme molybdopterin subunit
MREFSRRRFLEASAAGVLCLGLQRLAWSAADEARDGTATGPGVGLALPPDYRNWEDVYRQQWQWDRVVTGTHTNANCVAACAWHLYVREGIVWREEQAAPPLRRVGARGSGRWERISWDTALEEIVRALVPVLAERGGEGVLCEFGGHIDYGPTTAAAFRFFRQIGAPITDVAAQIGDLPVGGTITLGLPFTDGSSDDWFRSKHLVLWAFNPAVTRIPDAHYLNEARYRGARVVCIAPDFNQSATHADLWISPRPGTDAALALAACHVVIEEGLYQADYIREQTDLPFLVRTDTKRFLRESDVEAGGKEDRFAFWDEAANALAWAPGSAGSSARSLQLAKGTRPALEAATEVRLVSGEVAPVRTVFSLLRHQLQRFRPEDAAAITGVAPAVIRRFALDFARAPSALILSQFGSCKNYHSDLVQRSQILLASLTGNLGRAGGGWRSGAYVALDGLGLVAMQDELDILHLLWTAAQAQFDAHAVRSRFESMFVPGTLFHAVHGGLAEQQTAAAYGDPALADGAGPHLAEALAKGHFPMRPAPGAPPPEIIFSVCGNVLRHSRMGDRLRDGLFARAKLVVDVTNRMSETARHADILLPAAGWYEKIGVKYIPTSAPYLTLGDRAVPPLAEAKPEWEIFARLASHLAAEARNRGITSVRGSRGDACDIANLGERFTDSGRFTAEAEEEVMNFILSVSAASRGVSVDDLRTSGGASRLSNLGPQGGTAGIFSDYDSAQPVVPLRDFVEKKRPYPTLTGRQQFYVDHPWFLQLDEQLPTHKEPPAAGGRRPFVLTGGHTRWSIHAIWRDHSMMLLRLQRGEPVVWLNDADARSKNIADHDLVRVSNDLGSFVARARVGGSIRPGQVHIFHAWEPYQFHGGDSHQALSPSPLKPTQLVGDYGHLHWAYGYYEPNQVDRDTRVDVARA